MDSLYYCPVSGRFSSSSFELYTPADTPIRRFENAAAGLRDVLDTAKVRVASELPDGSDACLAAFASPDGGTVLISRHAFGSDDLERISDELLLAAGRPDISGVRSAKLSPTGHVIVVIDYVPAAAIAASAEHAEALLADLRTIHDAGLVHGGINERFLNPEHSAGRRIFGVGLSETYAAWRRAEGLSVGDLRADPRFASPEELTSAPASIAGDSFALAAVILCEVQGAGQQIPPLEAVQGINNLFHKAAQRELLVGYLANVGDKRVRASLTAMLEPAREPDPRLWRMIVAVALGVVVLMLLWLVTRPDPAVHVAPNAAQAAFTGVECAGPGVAAIDGRCEPAEGYGRCANGTTYDPALRACVAASAQPVAQNGEAAAAEETVVAAEALPAGPYIHPVLTCGDGVRRVEGRFSFGNDDINLSQVERVQLSRLAAQCSGPASVVYYMSSPTLESRTNTIYDEFRSSSTCTGKCREVLPADPTAVLFVPYIGLLDRSISHYLFFHCCPL